MDAILNGGYREMWTTIVQVVQDPTSNLIAALLLLAVLSVIVLIVLLVAVMFLLGSDEGEDEEGFGGEVAAAAIVAEEEQEEEPEEEPEPTAPLGRRIVNAFAFWGIVLVLMVLVTGVVTTRPALCVSCHPGNPHAGKANDPHAKTKCYACHEAGDLVGTFTYSVVPRTLHFAYGFLGWPQAKTYGTFIPKVACERCHKNDIARTTTDEARGVKMSHTAPARAGAECVDCHALAGGIVSNNTVGMSPCLRCHDGKGASSECALCHTKDIAAAAMIEQSATVQAKDQVPTPDCGGCHGQAICDRCHGLRLPHTKQFLIGFHARQAVEDLWNNDGQLCQRCHPGRITCFKCHGPMLNHGEQHRIVHRYASPEGCSNGSCHTGRAFLAGRNFCELCHGIGIKPLAGNPPLLNLAPKKAGAATP